MVVYETIADERIELAADLLPYLWDHYSDSDNQVKGDILYLMGLSGRTDAAEKILSILKSEKSGEIIEAAEDALHTLNHTRSPD